MRAALRVGVLALQGDFAAHLEALSSSWASITSQATAGSDLAGQDMQLLPVRRAAEFEDLDALILPGGESSVMLRLLRLEGLVEGLRELILGGCPTLATCAGLILLAREVQDPSAESLDLLDICVSRNGYGRQVHSGQFALRGEGGFPDCTGIFIRAPRVTRVGPGIEILCRRDGDPVLLRKDAILAACFHPELETAHPVIDLFVRGLAQKKGLVAPHAPNDSAQTADSRSPASSLSLSTPTVSRASVSPEATSHR